MLALLLGTASARTDVVGPAYWLAYGKPVALCPGAREPVPFKLVGRSWGLVAGGALLCRDAGDAYALTVDYLNVSVDPGNDTPKREAVTFDWIGLSLYRPASQGGGVDWLFDAAQPIKGTLKRDARNRLVFGHLAFRVPKEPAAQAANMLIYLTFGGPLVALRVL